MKSILKKSEVPSSSPQEENFKKIPRATPKNSTNASEAILVALVMLGSASLIQTWKDLSQCYLPANWYLAIHYAVYMLLYLGSKFGFITTKAVSKFIGRLKWYGLVTVLGALVLSGVFGGLIWLKASFAITQDSMCKLTTAFKIVAISDFFVTICSFGFVMYVAFFEKVK